MALLHQLSPGYLELTANHIIQTSLFSAIVCVWVMEQCLRRPTWHTLEANDTLGPHLVVPGCHAGACLRVIGCWSDSSPSENKEQLRMADALPGPGNLSHASFCSLLLASDVLDCDFSLGYTRNGKGKDHTPDFTNGPGKWKPFRDGKIKAKKAGNKKSWNWFCFHPVTSGDLPTIIIDTCDRLSFIFSRWSPQTYKNWRGLCLQRQGGSPPLEPETLWSSWRGNIIPGGSVHCKLH